MAPNPKEAAAPVGAGVRSLMRGNQPPSAAAAPVVKPPEVVATPAPKPAVPRWYLFAGDVLLVALALVTMLTSPHPLSWPREIFCAALVIVAAVLAVVALLMPEGKPANTSNKP